MNKTAQTKIVRDLCNAIALEIISKIEGGRIPEEWDGIELRALVTKKAQMESRWLTGNRRKDFENHCLINCISSY